jgi:hypothetical protein
MKTLALITAALSLLLRLLALGWVVVAGGWIAYPLIAILHSVIHFSTLSPPIPTSQSRLAFISNGLLLVGFAFQIDFGDGPCGYMPITMLFSSIGIGTACPFESSRFACGFMPLTNLLSQIGLARHCPYEVSRMAFSEGSVWWMDTILFIPVIFSWTLLMSVARRRSRSQVPGNG